MSAELRSTGSGGRGTPGTSGARHAVLIWQVLSALFLLAMGGIHLYLVLHGVGGVLGALFVMNVIGAFVLAIAMIVLPRRLLLVGTVLSLLFMAGTLLALVLALTLGLFGIHETLHFHLVPTTLVVESVGMVILVVTAAQVRRLHRAT
jgi:hypothetical protein